jgi:hypothetical protein
MLIFGQDGAVGVDFDLTRALNLVAGICVALGVTDEQLIAAYRDTKTRFALPAQPSNGARPS